MSLTCGLVGLPNAGKSTIFNALTAGHAAVASYPFTTVDPNRGVAPVPDGRLERLGSVLGAREVRPTTLELFDIAGLVEGASRGEGLGNMFLSHIRAVDAVVHVVRCFDAPDVPPGAGTVDPERDIALVETELALSDLEVLGRRRERLEKTVRAGTGDAAELEAVSAAETALNETGSLAGLDARHLERLRGLGLITQKPVIYVANVGDDDLAGEGKLASAVRRHAESLGRGFVPICAKLEAEAVQMGEEGLALLREMGVPEPGLARLVREARRALSLVTFYTVAGGIVSAWTAVAGEPLVRCAERIHSDMGRGFIRAEVVSCERLLELGSWSAAHDAGALRTEGPHSPVADGDVLYVHFH